MRRESRLLTVLCIVAIFPLFSLVWLRFQSNKKAIEALPTPAESWLEEHANQATRMTVFYGSTLPASIQKKVVMTDQKCILLTLSALRCRGDLTSPKGARYQENGGYNGDYRIILDFKAPTPSETLGISPWMGPELGSGRHYIITRSGPAPTYALIGYAETDESSFPIFSQYLNSCPAARKVWRGS